MMNSVQLFILVSTAIAIFWIIIQFYVLRNCVEVNSVVPLSSHLLCQREKNLMLLHGFNLARQSPECHNILKEMKSSLNTQENLPTLYLITPTYKRAAQKAELIRLSHTFLLIPKIHWILVEDSENKTKLVTRFLQNAGLSYTHLNVPTPPQFKTSVQDPNWLKPRGVLQRNIALSWIRQHLSVNDKGVVYFADDDNTYDLELFEEMRYTKKVSVWPVGLVGGLMVERPLVKHGKVVGWNTVWKSDRPFPLDMAGFAVNLNLLFKHPESAFSIRVPRGYQESKLLKDLVTVDELEPKADNCTKVLVWHTRTEHPKLKQEKKLVVPSDFEIEV